LAIIIFGIPYSFMEIIFDQNMSFKISQIGLAILNMVQGKSWNHMWYLYMIAGLYLCMPIIKVFVVNVSKRVIKYILIVLFIFTSVIPSLESILPYKFGINIPINSVYVFYLILGYYIHYNNVALKNRILFTLVILYLLYVGLMPLNENFYILSGEGSGAIILNVYNSPIVVMVTFAVFCIFRQHIKAPRKIINFIVPLCFGIYLIHPLFINLLYKFIKLSPEKYPLIIVLVLVSVITLVLSFSFSYFARKLEILRNYVL
jgi:surface polysaccharide O-acyltransferase-like enzyme